jgi:hypothetical protein
MKKLMIILGLLSLTSLSFAGVCRTSLLHTTLPTGSQTIVFGCDSQNIPYKSLLLNLYRKTDMMKSVRILVDSRDTTNPAMAALKIGLLSDGDSSPELYRSIRKEVLAEMRLALDSSEESEQNDHLSLGTENLKRILTED